MTTATSTTVSSRSFDDRGRAVRLTENEIRERNALALAALDILEEIGDDAEQRETLDYLMRIVDEDRPRTGRGRPRRLVVAASLAAPMPGRSHNAWMAQKRQPPRKPGSMSTNNSGDLSRMIRQGSHVRTPTHAAPPAIAPG